MESEVKFAVDVDGTEETDTFTTDDVSDDRAGYLPDVARSYAQHLAVDRFGTGIDVNTVRIVRLGTPSDEFDETGGVGM